MAGKKYEFRPDPTGHDWVSKVLLTRKQKKSLLKWLLYSLICVAGLVLQDSMLAKLRILGGGFDLAPALVVLICVLEGCDTGSVFALGAALVYAFSGSAQGRYCIVMLTAAAILAAGFRQSYLRRGQGSDMICVGGAMLLYELFVFAVGVIQELTYPGRWFAFVMTALVSTLTAAVFYRPLKHIGTIGGNEWKE